MSEDWSLKGREENGYGDPDLPDSIYFAEDINLLRHYLIDDLTESFGVEQMSRIVEIVNARFGVE